MHTRHLRAALIGLTIILGCRAPDVSDDVNTYVNSTNEVRAMLCDCMLDLSMPDVECDPSLELFTQFDADCMVTALDGHERDGLEYLDCVNTALADYVQCVSANVVLRTPTTRVRQPTRPPPQAAHSSRQSWTRVLAHAKARLRPQRTARGSSRAATVGP